MSAFGIFILPLKSFYILFNRSIFNTACFSFQANPDRFVKKPILKHCGNLFPASYKNIICIPILLDDMDSDKQMNLENKGIFMICPYYIY